MSSPSRGVPLYSSCAIAKKKGAIPPARIENRVQESDIAGLGSVLLSFYAGPLQNKGEWFDALNILRSYLVANQAVVICRRHAKVSPVYGIVIGAETPQTTFERSYETSFHKLEPFQSIPFGHSCVHQDIMDDQQWLGSSFYREFLLPMNVHHVLAADVALDDLTTCCIRICRSQHDPWFSSVDKERLSVILPHVKRAMQLSVEKKRAERSTKLFESVFDTLGVGVMFLDGEGNVSCTNEFAKGMLNDSRGLFLSRGRLAAVSVSDNKSLKQLIATATAAREQGRPTPTESLLVSGGERYGAIGLTLRYIGGDLNAVHDDEAVFAVFFRDLSQDTNVSEEVMRKLFSLTVAEATLASLLVKGLTIDDAAEQLHVSRNTIRTQLQSVFSKLGCYRQTDVVRTILGSVAMLS